MIHMYKLSLILLCLLAVGCSSQDTNMTISDKIVVEGWIQEDSCATVILSHSFRSSASGDIKVDELVIKDTEVTVSDGVESERLVPEYDKECFPHYVYRGHSLKGKVGGYYDLHIKQGESIVTSRTTILSPKRMDSMSVQQIAPPDSLFQIEVFLNAHPLTNEYYQILVKRTNKGNRFSPSFLGTIRVDANQKEKLIRLPVYQSLAHLSDTYELFFALNDTIDLKFTKITEEVYDFWNSYFNHVSNIKNPIAISTSNAKSNIKGGLGYWMGYAGETYRLVMSDAAPLH